MAAHKQAAFFSTQLDRLMRLRDRHPEKRMYCNKRLRQIRLLLEESNRQNAETIRRQIEAYRTREERELRKAQFEALTRKDEAR